MINSANAAAIIFATWFALSIALAPMIGKMLSRARRVEKGEIPVTPTPRPTPTYAPTRTASLPAVPQR